MKYTWNVPATHKFVCERLFDTEAVQVKANMFIFKLLMGSLYPGETRSLQMKLICGAETKMSLLFWF